MPMIIKIQKFVITILTPSLFWDFTSLLKFLFLARINMGFLYHEVFNELITAHCCLYQVLICCRGCFTRPDNSTNPPFCHPPLLSLVPSASSSYPTSPFPRQYSRDHPDPISGTFCGSCRAFPLDLPLLF